MKKVTLVFWLVYFGYFSVYAQTDWNLDTERISSKWAKQVNPENVWQEYPRPQLVREQWLNLNGLWDYSITDSNKDNPGSIDGKILVPFAVESALSGVTKRVSENNLIWYKRSFEIPANWKGKDILLHFGAVDWEAIVYVNGIKVGSHQGGYTPFSFDISRALIPTGTQELLVKVWDPTSNGTQPRGKQVVKPQGIWYTPVSGIWQTVWLEPVASQSIASLRITPDIDNSQLKVKAIGKTNVFEGYKVVFQAYNGTAIVASTECELNADGILNINKPKLWSPDNPFLYDLKVTLKRKGKAVDEIKSYFAMRKISVGIGDDGHERIYLNNELLFQLGTLDQGWWPGGLYTAPSFIKWNPHDNRRKMVKVIHDLFPFPMELMSRLRCSIHFTAIIS